MLYFKRLAAAAILPVALSLGVAAPAAAEDGMLPKTLTWTTYDVGSSGYVEASAIADALIKEYGVKLGHRPLAPPKDWTRPVCLPGQ